MPLLQYNKKKKHQVLKGHKQYERVFSCVSKYFYYLVQLYKSLHDLTTAYNGCIDQLFWLLVV